MKNIYLLGATGSIGTQTLKVISEYPDEFKVVTMSCKTRIQEIIPLIEKYRPKYVAVWNKEDADRLADRYEHIVFGYGEFGLIQCATFHPKDQDALVVNALVGISGLKPTVEAIKIGRNIALANKETLVVAGDIVTKLAEEKKVSIYPIDSEHSAIWQCLNGEDKNKINQVIITASGGSLRDYSVEELKHITVKEALNHPNWVMGNKITIDSATMMNKGFEMMEAKHLFGLNNDQISAILHPESIVHSMVEFCDHSIIAQISSHDMVLPIEYALFFPERRKSLVESLDFKKGLNLHFYEIPEEKYPCFILAKKAMLKGGNYPCALNAANEVAVELFLKEKISLTQISKLIESELEKLEYKEFPTLEELLILDQQIQNRIRNQYHLE